MRRVAGEGEGEIALRLIPFDKKQVRTVLDK